MSQNLSSAAVVIGALKVIMIRLMNGQAYKNADIYLWGHNSNIICFLHHDMSQCMINAQSNLGSHFILLVLIIYMGFRVCDQVRLNLVCSATETS